MEQNRPRESRNRLIETKCIFYVTKEERPYNGTKIVSSTNDAGITGDPYVKKKKNHLNTDFTALTKISLKWITDLNVKPKTIKLLEDIIQGKN